MWGKSHDELGMAPRCVFLYTPLVLTVVLSKSLLFQVNLHNRAVFIRWHVNCNPSPYSLGT